MWHPFKLAFLVLAMAIALSSSVDGQSSETPIDQWEKLLDSCHAWGATKCLDQLDQLFSSGYANPSHVMTALPLRFLREEESSRTRLHRLWSRHAREHSVLIADEKETGDRMIIRGQLVSREGVPVTGAKMYFFHTDDEGLYAPEYPRAGHGTHNPWLFAYVITDATGQFEVQTVRPNSYPGYRNLRHVHFEIDHPGCRQNSQFYLDEDPVPNDEQIRNARARNFPILHAEKDDDGIYIVKFTRAC